MTCDLCEATNVHYYLRGVLLHNIMGGEDQTQYNDNGRKVNNYTWILSILIAYNFYDIF